MPKNTRDDDYDDKPVQDRPRRKAAPAKSGGGGNPVLVVLLILGGVFLVVLLVCGGIGIFIASRATWTTFAGTGPQTVQVDLQEAERKWKRQDAAAPNEQERGKAFLEYWLAELCANSLDDAYQRTTKAFQARMSRVDFGNWVQNNPDLKQAVPVWTYGLNLKGPKYTYLLGGHTPPYHLVATKEGGEWKVDDVYVIGQH